MHCYARFIGAMAARAQLVTSLANELVKIMEDVKDPVTEDDPVWKAYRFAEG